jgi:hypothetical protein
MIKKKHGFRFNCATDWHPEKKEWHMPKIVSHLTIDGIKYYLCDQGKMYVAELFDKFFNVKRGTILNKKYKGVIQESQRVILSRL